MNNNTIPWLFAAATAVWFGLLAFRAQRSFLLWGFGGGLFALVTSTIVFGLARATYIALSHEAYVHRLTQALFLSFFLILVLGWFFTASLHHHQQALWQLIRGRLGDTPPSPAADKKSSVSPPA